MEDPYRSNTISALENLNKKVAQLEKKVGSGLKCEHHECRISESNYKKLRGSFKLFTAPMALVSVGIMICCAAGHSDMRTTVLSVVGGFIISWATALAISIAVIWG